MLLIFLVLNRICGCHSYNNAQHGRNRLASIFVSVSVTVKMISD